MRVFTAAFATETNSFSPIPTDRRSFERGVLKMPGELSDKDVKNLFFRVMECAREKAATGEWALSEGAAAFAEPAGPLSPDCYHEIRGAILAALKQTGPVDAVLLGLHGAMMAYGEDDCEGDLLSRVRTIVGPDTIIAGLLDPHAHLTDKMTEAADLLMFFRLNPHTDSRQRAETLVKRVERLHKSHMRPVHAVYDCRMAALFNTDLPATKCILSRLNEAEDAPAVIAAEFVHGFRRGDVEDLGAKILVTTDDDHALAQRTAAELGAYVFSLRGQTAQEFLLPEDAVARVRSNRSAPWVLADSADNPGGGAPGDSMTLLATLLASGEKNIAIGPVWDPMAVAFAMDAGEGAEIPLRVGGKASAMSGQPLNLKAHIGRIVHDFVQDFGGAKMKSGNAVAVHAEGLSMVLTSLRCQCFDKALFETLGIDLHSKDIIVVKSSQHFRSSFAELGFGVAVVDGPGVCSQTISADWFTKLKRPLWPFVDHPFAPMGGESGHA